MKRRTRFIVRLSSLGSPRARTTRPPRGIQRAYWNLSAQEALALQASTHSLSRTVRRLYQLRADPASQWLGFPARGCSRRCGRMKHFLIGAVGISIAPVSLEIRRRGEPLIGSAGTPRSRSHPTPAKDLDTPCTGARSAFRRHSKTRTILAGSPMCALRSRQGGCCDERGSPGST